MALASIISVLKRKLASILPLPSAGSDLERATVARVAGIGSEANDLNDDDDDSRPVKRQRRSLLVGDVDKDASTAKLSGTATPYLLSETARFPPSPDYPHNHVSSGLLKFEKPSSSSSSSLISLTHLPQDVLTHCLYYIHTRSDRFTLQVSCKTLYHASNTDKMLVHLDLGGDVTAIAHSRGTHAFYGELDEDAATSAAAADDDNDVDNDDDPDAFAIVRRLQLLRHRGNLIGGNEDDEENVGETVVPGEHGPAGAAASQSTKSTPSRPSPIANGFILESDTSVAACTKLVKFAAAGNVQAIYMIAMILCYCHENIPEGVALLTHAAKSSHAPSIYALALILRDSCHSESNHYLDIASSLGYAPAWQEKLTATEFRARFGDLDANALLQYLDPPCLNSLLGRHYVECSRVRRHQTSHCWNPLCGRWAYKAPRGDGGAEGGVTFHQMNQIRLARLRAIWHERNNNGINQHDVARDNDIDDRINHHLQQQLTAGNDLLEPMNGFDRFVGMHGDGHGPQPSRQPLYSIEPLVAQLPNYINNRRGSADSSSTSSSSSEPSSLNTLLEALRNKPISMGHGLKVSRMKMCSSCRRAKYCSKLCQVFDWRSGKHKMECQYL